MAIIKTIDETESIVDAEQFLLNNTDKDHYIICKGADKLNVLVNSIKSGTTTHFISNGDWSMHDITIKLLQQYKPAELYITSYAIREFSIRQLILAQQRNEITSIKMLLDYRAKVRTPDVFEMASMNVNKIRLTSLHAKVTIIKSDIGYVSIVGSANWTSNPRIEAGVISLNKDVANFHINWINKVLENAENFE